MLWLSIGCLFQQNFHLKWLTLVSEIVQNRICLICFSRLLLLWFCTVYATYCAISIFWWTLVHKKFSLFIIYHYATFMVHCIFTHFTTCQCESGKDWNLDKSYMYLKSPQLTESLKYFENHIFLELFGNKIYCIAYHCKAYSFCFTMLP